MEVTRRATHAIGRLARFFANRCLILMYHRVAACDKDPWSLCVSPDHFAEHLQVLKQNFAVVTVQDLGHALKRGHLPSNAVAITFDDGYADNLLSARPLLAAAGLPATVFVTTGQLARSREFWWDELEKLVLNDDPLPATLTLSVGGRTQIFETSPASGREDMRSVRAWEGGPGSRMALYHALWEALLSLPADEQVAALDQLGSLTNATADVRPTHRSMSAAEICELARDDLIRIGAHTVTHPLLTARSEGEQRQEIEISKAQLEELIGGPVNCFAYPFGDHDSITAGLAEAAGFDCACTTVEDTVWRFAHPYRMPRFAVADWDGDEFARRLHSQLR